MGLSKDTEFRMDHAVTDDKIGDEIAARVEATSTPALPADAQAILDLLDADRNDAVAERLTSGLAGDGKQGQELAKKINGMMAVLDAKANAGNIADAQAEMGSEEMSEDARRHLEHALGSKDAANEVKASYDAMVAAMQAIV